MLVVVEVVVVVVVVVVGWERGIGRGRRKR